MATFSIKDPEDTQVIKYYGYYGPSFKSLSLGSSLSVYGSKVIDGPETDKILPSGTFSHDNNKPIASRETDSIANLASNVLLNMGKPAPGQKTYPGQDIFGKEYTLQYIYSNNPNKDRIGVF